MQLLPLPLRAIRSCERGSWNHGSPPSPSAAAIRAICNSESLPIARDKLAAVLPKYSASAPKLASWMEANLPEGFTLFSFPEPIRKRLRTSNLSEAIN